MTVLEVGRLDRDDGEPPPPAVYVSATVTLIHLWRTSVATCESSDIFFCVQNYYFLHNYFLKIIYFLHNYLKKTFCRIIFYVCKIINEQFVIIFVCL